jgi:hypothetical protein
VGRIREHDFPDFPKVADAIRLYRKASRRETVDSIIARTIGKGLAVKLRNLDSGPCHWAFRTFVNYNPVDHPRRLNGL